MVVLYTNHCPKCEVLKKKLDDANITYEVEEDINKLIDLGIEYVPILETEEEGFLDFSSAVSWINNL